MAEKTVPQYSEQQSLDAAREPKAEQQESEQQKTAKPKCLNC
jgi:hypothetical protein